MNQSSKVWIILELYDTCQIEKQLDTIAAEIKLLFGPEVEYFIPVHVESVGERQLVASLFDGYVFVEISGVPNVYTKINNIRGSNIAGPLKDGKKSYSTIADSEINRYREELRGRLFSWIPNIGDEVVPKIGMFRNLVGNIVSVDERNNTAKVVFSTRSREVTSDVKLLNLVPRIRAEDL